MTQLRRGNGPATMSFCVAAQKIRAAFHFTNSRSNKPVLKKSGNKKATRRVDFTLGIRSDSGSRSNPV